MDGGPRLMGFDALPTPRATPGSPMDRFSAGRRTAARRTFRVAADLIRGGRRLAAIFVTGQGSGFFISADGMR